MNIIDIHYTTLILQYITVQYITLPYITLQYITFHTWHTLHTLHYIKLQHITLHYVHTYIHTYIHVYIRTFVHSYIHTYIYIYIAWLFTHIFICVDTRFSQENDEKPSGHGAPFSDKPKSTWVSSFSELHFAEDWLWLGSSLIQLWQL
jgi:hypothetical protein